MKIIFIPLDGTNSECPPTQGLTLAKSALSNTEQRTQLLRAMCILCMLKAVVCMPAL